MRKKLLTLFLGLICSYSFYGQIGINTPSPKVTLEVTPKATDGSTSEGIISPRLTGNALHQADINGVYGYDQDGAIAFVTSAPSTGNRVGQTIDIDSRGYYYYDYPANKWIKILYSALGAVVGALDCAGATVSGSLINGQIASGVTVSINYTGGNGGTYFGGAISSTGVTGLTASLSSGTISSGFGTLQYTISGTPSSTGSASFSINFGGYSCTVSVNVGGALALCGAYIAPGQWKNFMCQNLGADMSADPFVPSASIHGDKYQWGATTNQTGRYYSQADDLSNSGNITGWDSTFLPDNTWMDDVKTANDPCPAGYRVPTRAQWQGILNNPTLNPVTRTGSWANSTTNYTTVIKFGDYLLLPAAGHRSAINGALTARGISGSYWSSTQVSGAVADGLYFGSSGAFVLNFNRSDGYAVRCIAE